MLCCLCSSRRLLMCVALGVLALAGCDSSDSKVIAPENPTVIDDSMKLEHGSGGAGNGGSGNARTAKAPTE